MKHRETLVKLKMPEQAKLLQVLAFVCELTISRSPVLLGAILG